MDDEDIKCFVKLVQIAIVTTLLVILFAYAFIQYFPTNLYLVMIIVFGLDVPASLYIIRKNEKRRRKKSAHNSRDNIV